MTAGISISVLRVLFFFAAVSAAALFSRAAPAADALPFTERGGLKYVTAQINGTPIELVFDTGANSIVLNRAALQRLGIAGAGRNREGRESPEGRKVQSQTAGGVVDGYLIALDSVKAGPVQKYNYDVAYLPSSVENLLGASFFEDYSFFIDEDYKVIRLVPRGSYVFERPGRPPADAPRTGSGRIEVEVDGATYVYGEEWLKPGEKGSAPEGEAGVQ